ncbi:biotin transporter BioY [Bradyrhizobium tropiciagri]|uniref:biotin transporter BioY n=1 Tax=Bradyrhizobium tropiciagri TaxID=312253 RepID=UPI001BA4E287|nr:biotin transporter BioY [Bradyrhizobium tropiciagri]MBR0899175.1 biotin transporter BioY [Bradyrhizobium tropiciagri]
MTLFTAIAGRRAPAGLALDALTVAAASLLLTLSAKVTVPFFPVPLSMQTFVAIGLGLALGPVRGGAAVLFYLAQGAVGLPVFAGTPQQGLGLAYMVGPTGGYLAGFFVQAVVAGLFAQRGWDRQPLTAMVAALVAAATIYLTGLPWLGTVIGFDKPVIAYGLTPFVLGDVVKAMLAALIFPMAWKAIADKADR